MQFNKLFRILFKLKYLYYTYWNRIKFKIYGIEFGKGLQVNNKLYIYIGENAKVEIGENFTFSSGDNINPISRNVYGSIFCANNTYLKIGNNVKISGSSLRLHKSIIIGNNVTIGADCILLDSNSHSMNYLDRRDPIKDKTNKIDKAITIDDDVFIGTRCIILKGVTIGARSIIGSGSVVTKSIPADSIAVGNPAKVVRTIAHK